MAHLKENSIETRIHYPVTLPFLKAYDYLRHTPTDFPVAYECQTKKKGSLPMYLELTETMTKYITNTISQLYGED